MSKIFLCPGNCNRCKVVDCPERGTLDKNKDPIQLLKDSIEQAILKKTTVRSIFEILQESDLFNVIQRWEILKGEGEEIEKTNIEKEIIEMIPGLCMGFKDDPFEKKARVIVSIIAEKILISLEGKCQESCYGCYLTDCCSQKKATQQI